MWVEELWWMLINKRYPENFFAYFLTSGRYSLWSGEYFIRSFLPNVPSKKIMSSFRWSDFNLMMTARIAEIKWEALLRILHGDRPFWLSYRKQYVGGTGRWGSSFSMRIWCNIRCESHIENETTPLTFSSFISITETKNFFIISLTNEQHIIFRTIVCFSQMFRTLQ